MLNVFLSWYDGQNHSAAKAFFEVLKQHGFALNHSPASPHSGSQDKRWENWYVSGLSEAIEHAEIFIAVITPAYDSSTWMLQEFEIAYSRFLKIGKPALYFIQFDSTEQPKYPEYYLASAVRLSSNYEEAVQTLIHSSS